MITHARSVAALSLLLASGALADLNYPNFSSTAGLTLIGNAAVNGTDLRLTPALKGQLGIIWTDTKQPIAGGFTTTFQFRISEPGGVPDFFGMLGADGMALVIQNFDPIAQGEGGSGMGYSTIPDSLAVEFDTWGHPFFGDPNSNHTSIQSLGTQPNSYTPQASLGLASNIPELTSGQVFTARITYGGGVLKEYLNDMTTPVLMINVDLSTLLALDNGKAYVGFTASTGGAWENHDLLSWTMSGGCYPDCDGNGTLNINDFICFQTKFALGDPYADCDGNGTRNINDFICFQTKFALGCP